MQLGPTVRPSSAQSPSNGDGGGHTPAGSWEADVAGLDVATHPDADRDQVPPTDPASAVEEQAASTSDLVGDRMKAFRRRHGVEDDLSPERGQEEPRPSRVRVSPPAQPSSAAERSPHWGALGGTALLDGLKRVRLSKSTTTKISRLAFSAFWVALFLVVLLQLRTPAFHWIDSQVAEARQRASFEVFGDFRYLGGGAGRPIGKLDLMNASLRNRTDFRLDFAAAAAKGGIGWMLRAVDRDNYYAFRIEPVGRKLQFRRYPVINGVALKDEQITAPVTNANIRDGIKISARISGARISTFVNGNGVDYFREERLNSGGVGFFTEGRDEASLTYYTVRGNQDNWGLTLFGMIGLWDDTVAFFADESEEDFIPTELTQVSEPAAAK